MKGAPQKPITGSRSAKCFATRAHGFGDIAKFGGAVGAQVRDVFLAADGFLDDGTFSGGEMKGQAHDFEGKQKVGEDDGGVDAEDFGGGDGDLGGERGLLANLKKRMLFADARDTPACSDRPGA